MTDFESLQRIAMLEAQYAALRVELQEANRELGGLVRMAAMGRGAWAAIMKMGALLAVLDVAGASAWHHLRWLLAKGSTNHSTRANQ